MVRYWVSHSVDTPSPPIHPLYGYQSLFLKHRPSRINSLIKIIQWLPVGCRINSTLCMSRKAPKPSHSPRVQHEQPWILPSQRPCCSRATSSPQSTPQTGHTFPHLVLEEASSSCCSLSQQLLPAPIHLEHFISSPKIQLNDTLSLMSFWWNGTTIMYAMLLGFETLTGFIKHFLPKSWCLGAELGHALRITSFYFVSGCARWQGRVGTQWGRRK